MYDEGVDYSIPEADGIHPTLDRDAPWIQADNPEKGLAIRQAMSLAIDRQLIIDRLLNGEASYTHGPLLQYNDNPELVDPAWVLPAFDIEAAKAKLAEGGYPNGFEFTMFQYSSGEVDLASIGEAIAGMWEELGLTVTRNRGDEEILDAKLDKADTAGWVWVTTGGFNPEPGQSYSRFSVTKGRDYRFVDAQFETDYARISQETNLSERFAIARETITHMRDNVHPISLFTVNELFVAGPKVGSWDPIPGMNVMSRLETVLPAN
jgi:ABC-type transport system substrate-binding protein